MQTFAFARAIQTVASLVLVAVFVFSGSGGSMAQTGGMRLKPVGFDALTGWSADRHSEIVAPMVRSCDALLRAGETFNDRPIAAGKPADWRDTCQVLIALAAQDPGDVQVRKFIEEEFQPYAVSAGDEDQGLFTGYFELAMTGSLIRKSENQVPLYRLPEDDALREQPRADIVAGGLNGRGLELVWIDDPIDAFFVEVQGSGVVKLDDGSVRRVRFAGRNGFTYSAIGRKLVEDGILYPEDVSMQSIIQWMRANPDQQQTLMNHNESFVFFDWRDVEAPIGASGVGLTPGRSLAVDPSYIPYGAPIWLETTHPIGNAPLNRLVMAQDTGGAIRGAVRGDFFWGNGPAATEAAGLMKQEGRYFLLLPRRLKLALRENGSLE